MHQENRQLLFLSPNEIFKKLQIVTLAKPSVTPGLFKTDNYNLSFGVNGAYMAVQCWCHFYFNCQALNELDYSVKNIRILGRNILS